MSLTRKANTMSSILRRDPRTVMPDLIDWFEAPFTLKLSAENLLDDEVLVTQGGLVQDKFTKGITVRAGLAYSF